MGYRDLGSHCPAQLQLRSAVLAAIGGDEVWPDGGAGVMPVAIANVCFRELANIGLTSFP